MNTDSNLWLVDHLDKCRCCFENINHYEKQVKITKIIKKQFLELTQIKLQASPNFSNIVCMKCTNELQSISSFRLILITKQQQLYEFVTTSQYQIQDFIKFEPVNIKDETQSSEDFDFDTHYEEIESPEVPVISETTKTEKQLPCLKSDNQSSKKESLKRLRKTQKPKQQTRFQTKGMAKQFKSELTCSECDNVFHNPGNLSNHIRRVHLKEKHCFCDFCGYGSFSKKDLVLHMKIHLRKMICEIKAKKKFKYEKVMCPHCGVFLNNAGSLKNHILQVHLKVKHFFCDLCDYGAIFKHTLSIHMKTHLPLLFREKYFCDQCEYVSISIKGFRSHQKHDHNNEGKTFECHCGRVFDKNRQLNTHKRYAHGKYITNNKNVCTICERSFVSPSALKIHMVSHTNKREVSCEICGKMFKTILHLKKHSVHHEELQFVCNFEGCTKKYFKSSLLEAHKKTHIDQRDYACHLCDKKYFNSYTLSRHVLHFHGQRKFICEVPGCSSKLSRKETYKHHVETQHKDFPQDVIQPLLKKIKEMKTI